MRSLVTGPRNWVCEVGTDTDLAVSGGMEKKSRMTAAASTELGCQVETVSESLVDQGFIQEIRLKFSHQKGTDRVAKWNLHSYFICSGLAVSDRDPGFVYYWFKATEFVSPIVRRWYFLTWAKTGMAKFIQVR